MVKSSQTLTFSPPSSPPTTRTLRKAHSSDSLASPRPRNATMERDFSLHTGGFIPGSALGSQSSLSVAALNVRPYAVGGHARGVSVDVWRTTSQGQAPPVVPSEFSNSKLVKDTKSISAARLCSILTGTSSTQLELETVKKLRLLLRNESARSVIYIYSSPVFQVWGLTCNVQLVIGVPPDGRLRIVTNSSQRDFRGRMAVCISHSSMNYNLTTCKQGRTT